jgi:hypothetical protein
MTSSFKLTPSEVDQAGSHMQDLGSKIDQHATNVASTHQKISSSSRSDKSKVGKMFTTFASKSGTAFSDGFKGLSRWSKEAGNRLKIGSSRTKQTESDVTSSINKIKAPSEDAKARPKTPNPAGPSGPAESSSEPTPHRPPTPNKETGGKTDDQTSTEHEPPVSKPPEPKPKVAPAGDRLSSWLGNAGTPDVMQIRPNRRPPALQHFGDTGHDQMYDIEHQSQDYQGNGSGARPTQGGRFQSAFGQDGDKHSAVVMETYVAGGENKPTYTASDGFLHQWGAAHAGFNTPGGAGKKTSAIENHLGSDTSYPDRLPDKLPDSIYHQNISGEGAKTQLGSILDGKENPHQLSSDELNQVLKTDNGKSVNNIVRTYNDVKGDTYGITGGAVGKDDQGNYHLKFDTGRK